MSPSRSLTRGLKSITRVLCRVHDAQLVRVPLKGPLILATNHINFLEVPLMFTHLQPRPLTGFAKAETWDNPLMAWLFDLWGAIPLERGEPDLKALRRGMDVLERGGILTVAPEGTRSGSGQLQRAHGGIVFVAQHSRAPILPVVYYGGERLYDNLRNLRRTDFHIVVGEPFLLHLEGIKLTKEKRQEIADAIMFRLAALLPDAYRGAYNDLNASRDEAFIRPFVFSSN